jgi:5-carboxymethyl-2-hydroxymuconate isomerase
MPHLVVEYSEGALDKAGVGTLLQALHHAAAGTGVMQAADIKLRARAHDDYLVAGIRDSFVHVTVSMLAGRSPEQKLALSLALREAMVAHCPAVTSLSVDIRDMDPDAYKKRLL